MNNISQLNAFIESCRHRNIMRKRNQLVDFALVNDNGDEVWGHMIIMASTCPLILETARRGESRLLLKNINAETLEHLVNYMYITEVNLTRDNVDDILAGATELSIQHLRSLCLDFLENNANGNGENLTRRCLG